jgi:hypothetical protein
MYLVDDILNRIRQSDKVITFHVAVVSVINNMISNNARSRAELYYTNRDLRLCHAANLI